MVATGPVTAVKKEAVDPAESVSPRRYDASRLAVSLPTADGPLAASLVSARSRWWFERSSSPSFTTTSDTTSVKWPWISMDTCPEDVQLLKRPKSHRLETTLSRRSRTSQMKVLNDTRFLVKRNFRF